MMSAIVAVSTFGALNGVILSGPRAYLAMARDGLLFAWAAAIHPRFHTPHRAIVLQGAWAIVLVSTGTYRALFTRVVYTEWIFFALMAVGLMRLRARGVVRAGVSRVGISRSCRSCSFSRPAYIVINQIVHDVERKRGSGCCSCSPGLPGLLHLASQTLHSPTATTC